MDSVHGAPRCWVIFLNAACVLNAFVLISPSASWIWLPCAKLSIRRLWITRLLLSSFVCTSVDAVVPGALELLRVGTPGRFRICDRAAKVVTALVIELLNAAMCWDPLTDIPRLWNNCWNCWIDRLLLSLVARTGVDALIPRPYVLLCVGTPGGGMVCA